METIEVPSPLVELPAPPPAELPAPPPLPVAYTLTLNGEGLSSTPEAGEIIANTSVTITVTPPESKQLVSFMVNGEDRTDELVENKYTFTITADTTVAVTYEDIPDPEELAIKELKDKTALDVTVAGNMIMATVEYPDSIDSVLKDWMADVKLTLGNPIPEGTTVDVKYNGKPMASKVKVSGTQIYLGELLSGSKLPSVTKYKGEVDVWEVTMHPGAAVDTIVTMESVISKDNFAHEKVIAWGRASLSI